jgi:hypothetical protein
MGKYIIVAAGARNSMRDSITAINKLLEEKKLIVKPIDPSLFISVAEASAPVFTEEEYKEMLENCDSLIDNANSFMTGKPADDGIWQNDILQLNKIKKVLKYQKWKVTQC